MSSNPTIKAAAISDIDGHNRKIQVLFNNSSQGVVYIRAQDMYSWGHIECASIYNTYPKYTTFNDSWIDNPSSLAVRTHSCSTSGWEDCSMPDCATLQGPFTQIDSVPVKPYNTNPPGTPIVNATASGTGATITWDAVTDPTGGEVWAYHLKVTNTSTAQALAEGYVPNNEKSKTVSGIQSDITYKAEVYAISHNGINGTVGYKDFTSGSSNSYYYICENNVCNQKIGIGTSNCTSGVPCGTTGNNGNCKGKIICSIPDTYVYIGGGVLALMFMMMAMKK